MILLLTILFVTTTSFASPLEDPVRVSLREKLIENHMPIRDWKQAKHYLMQEIYLEKDKVGFFIKDVYCHHIVRKNISSSTMPDGNIINIEHTWPQSKFTKKKSKTQKSDLHHLFPTDTKINNERANHTFYELSQSSPMTDCPTSKIGYNRTLREVSFEPPSEHKGNVARALFYFAIRYKGRINDIEESVLRLWNEIDPVDDAEKKRNELIQLKQGNRNIFIDKPELANQILNF